MCTACRATCRRSNAAGREKPDLLRLRTVPQQASMSASVASGGAFEPARPMPWVNPTSSEWKGDAARALIPIAQRSGAANAPVRLRSGLSHAEPPASGFAREFRRLRLDAVAPSPRGHRRTRYRRLSWAGLPWRAPFSSQRSRRRQECRQAPPTAIEPHGSFIVWLSHGRGRTSERVLTWATR